MFLVPIQTRNLQFSVNDANRHFCHFSLRLRPVCSWTKQIFNIRSPCLEPRSLSSPSGGPDVKLTPNQKGATRPLNILNQNSEGKTEFVKETNQKPLTVKARCCRESRATFEYYAGVQSKSNAVKKTPPDASQAQ